MHQDFYQLAELAMGLVALFGLGVGLKVLVWDRLPVRWFRETTERRFTELEDRMERLIDLHEDQLRRLDEHDERLEFSERMLARGPTDARPGSGPMAPVTPV